MSQKRIKQLFFVFVFAGAPAIPVVPAAASTHATVGLGQRGPSIMQTAFEMAAGPAAQSLPPFTRTDPLRQSMLTGSAGPNLRREVFGFVNAANLGDPNVGYPAWNLNLLSTVAYFGLQVNGGNGALVQTDTGWSVYHSGTMSSFINAAHAAGTRAIVSINLHDFSGSATNQVCQGLAPANAQTTIAQVVNQMTAAGIDGINVDYEGLNTTCANGRTSRSELVAFVTALRAAMPRGSYLAVDTYSGSAADDMEFFDVAGLAAQVDALFVMAYDMDYSNYHYAPLNCPSFCLSPVSPLSGYRFNDTLAMSQYLGLAPASKVILGLPYYGRKACVPSLTDAHQVPTTFNSPYFVSPTYLYAAEVPSDTGVSNFSRHRDPTDGTTEWDTWYSTEFNCNREQYWDDVQSLTAKYDLVNSDNLRGVGLFALDYGGSSHELWAALASRFACAGSSFEFGAFSGTTRADLAVGPNGSCVMVSSGSGLSQPIPWTGVSFYGTKGTFAGDVNGDGRTDLVAVNAGDTYVMTSTGTSFSAPVLWSTTPFFGGRGTFLADLNGDGKLDLAAVNDTSTWVMLSNGSSFGPPTLWSNRPFYGSQATLVTDLAGSGKSDVIAVNRTSTWVMASSGTGFSAPALWSTSPFYGSVATVTGNVAGGAKADLIAVNSTGIWVMTSTGSKFNAPALWSNLAFYGTSGTFAADVTGDGTAELVAVNASSVWVLPSSGTAFGTPAIWFEGPP